MRTGTTAMVAALVWIPNTVMDHRLSGRTAARNKNTMPKTCIAQFQGSR